MKVAQIKDLQNLADGTTIGEMVVQVKKAWPPRTGESKHGSWRVQNCTLVDASGETRGSFWIQDDMADLEGQTITIRSRAGKKGLAGLSVQLSKHSGQNELKVTEQAAIIDAASGKIAELATPASRPAAVRSTPVAAGSVSDAKKFLFQEAQLMVEAVKAASWVGEQVKLTPEQLQAVASSLFISADRAGLARVFPTALKSEEPVTEEPSTEEDDDDLGF